MLISVEKVHLFINTDLSDEVLEAKLRALELMIRAYTHNNFQQRNVRSVCSTDGHTIKGIHPLIVAGDTIQITNSIYNDGVYNVIEVGENEITVNKPIDPEEGFTVTRVKYPEDVVSGVINILDWDINRRDKVGVQSETISRHSVTYFNMDDGNSSMGVPKAILGFLEPYRKARF